MKTMTFALGAAVSLLLMSSPSRAAEAGALRLFSTASTHAELHDCGCKKKPLGGLARRAHMIRQDTQDPARTLIVDAGDWAEHKEDLAWEKTELIWSMMADMGYEAVTPGARELAHGKGALEGLYASRSEVKVVSANITDKAGNRVWPESAVIEKAGRRIGLTGVTGSAPYVFNLTRGLQSGDDFDFQDPEQALREVVPRLKEQSDLVVVLCNTSAADARRLVDEVPGIDVLVVGHNPGYQFNPDRVASTIMVRAGSQGKYLSRLDLVLDEAGLVDYNGEAVPVHTKHPEDPALADRVARWETQFEVASR